MIITNRKVPSYFSVNFNGETISVVSKTKLILGGIIDDKLSFLFQVDNLTLKCMNFFFRRFSGHSLR